jgi:hypothetical protein
VLALIVIETVLVLLLTVLVAGLLRSHADILRALHSLGAGLGDPSADPARPLGHGGQANGWAQTDVPGMPVTMGPRLPAGRSTSSVTDVDGLTPTGDGIAVAVADAPHCTLLAFLTSGCASCASFWNALGAPETYGLPVEVRPVVVTKGPDFESPTDVSRLAPRQVPVVMSNEAWDAYEVPGSPFFVLVDGRARRRIGEGTALQFQQVADMVRRAFAESGRRAAPGRVSWAPEAADRARESDNDQELLTAGIHPGHRSLYPSVLEDIFEPPGPGNAGRGHRHDGAGETGQAAGPIEGSNV